MYSCGLPAAQYGRTAEDDAILRQHSHVVQLLRDTIGGLQSDAPLPPQPEPEQDEGKGAIALDLFMEESQTAGHAPHIELAEGLDGLDVEGEVKDVDRGREGDNGPAVGMDVPPNIQGPAVSDAKQLANEAKQRGNEALKAKKFHQAVSHYTEAIAQDSWCNSQTAGPSPRQPSAV